MSYVHVVNFSQRRKGRLYSRAYGALPLEEIIMNLYLQKGWDIVEVTNNSGSFNYRVDKGTVYPASDA